MMMFFRYLFKPSFWLSNERVDYQWDKKLNELLDNPKFKFKDEYTINLNGYSIWIQNYPYSYGRNHRISPFLPKRWTRERLNYEVNKFLAEQK